MQVALVTFEPALNHTLFITADEATNALNIAALNQTLNEIGVTLIHKDPHDAIYWPMAPNTFCSQIAEKLGTDQLIILTESSGKTILVDIGSHLRDEAGVGCWIDIRFLWSLMDIFQSRIILGKQYLRQLGSVTIDFDRMQLGIETPFTAEVSN